MNIKMLISCCFIFLMISSNKGFSQIENYGYNDWQEKNTDAKKNVVIKENFVDKYQLSIRKGRNDKHMSFRLPLHKTDSLKKGILKVKILSSSTEAQLALLDHLNSMSTPNIPLRLDDNLKYLDVAFGKEYNGVLEMAFTKNNIFVLLQAPVNEALSISKEIADEIEVAPVWSSGDQKPKLLLQDN